MTLKELMEKCKDKGWEIEKISEKLQDNIKLNIEA